MPALSLQCAVTTKSEDHGLTRMEQWLFIRRRSGMCEAGPRGRRPDQGRDANQRDLCPGKCDLAVAMTQRSDMNHFIVFGVLTVTASTRHSNQLALLHPR
jgi:hypothetical protein